MESTSYYCHILKKLDFFDRFPKNPQIPDFMKVRPLVAELFHVDIQTEGRTGMTKLLLFAETYSR